MYYGAQFQKQVICILGLLVYYPVNPFALKHHLKQNITPIGNWNSSIKYGLFKEGFIWFKLENSYILANCLEKKS